MKAKERLVIDTNAFISRLLLPNSIPAQAVRKAVDSGKVLVSEATLNELADVLSRTKFDAYVTLEERQQFLRLLARIVELVPIVYRVRVCRDPKDDGILEVAVNGSADFIITGDQDLLSLKHFQDIRIISPAVYLRI